MSLFDEIINCPDCLKTDVINEENRPGIEAHIDSVHSGVSMNAYIIAVADRLSPERDWIDNTYNDAKEYLDSNFMSSFLMNFEQRCWELSIYRYLIDNGITINTPSQAEGPDFDTSIGYVECIAIKRGNGANAIPLLEASILQSDGTLIEGGGLQPVPTNEVQLRISAAIAAKIEKYEGYTKKSWFIHSKPRLIAVNWWADGSSFGVGSSSDVTRDPMLRTLFGTGPLQLTIDNQTSKIVNQQPVRQLTIPNANKTEIDVHYFAKKPDNTNRKIDGVISSAKAPYVFFGSDLRIINNPFGRSIDMEAFTVGHKTRTELDTNGFSVKNF